MIGDRRLLFTERFEIEADFGNVTGIAIGTGVRLAGFDAGEVLGIEIPLNPRRAVPSAHAGARGPAAPGAHRLGGRGADRRAAGVGVHPDPVGQRRGPDGRRRRPHPRRSTRSRSPTSSRRDARPSAPWARSSSGFRTRCPRPWTPWWSPSPSPPSSSRASGRTSRPSPVRPPRSRSTRARCWRIRGTIVEALASGESTLGQPAGGRFALSRTRRHGAGDRGHHARGPPERRRGRGTRRPPRRPRGRRHPPARRRRRGPPPSPATPWRTWPRTPRPSSGAGRSAASSPTAASTTSTS